jgi:peptide-methionine (S)-S-oxide reductase
MFTSWPRLLRRLSCLAALLPAAVALAQPGAAVAPSPATAVATFAGGCFWCVEEAFDKVAGVLSTTSGFMGGTVRNPSYEQVVQGNTGHREVVRVVFDPARVSYEKLLDTFWRNIDPTQANGQFCDHGLSYRSEIFFHDEAQRLAAEASKAKLEREKPFSGDIKTVITAAGDFHAAEDYHQDYYLKNPLRYRYYKTACGREARLRFLWKSR